MKCTGVTKHAKERSAANRINVSKLEMFTGYNASLCTDGMTGGQSDVVKLVLLYSQLHMLRGELELSQE